jgi:transcriptional antiterminator RfaH
MTDWYVVYTHTHAEATAREHLSRQGYESYLPCYRKRRCHARRVEQVSRPLFPRYLFVTFDLGEDRWRPILSTVGVCGLVRHGEVPTRVPEGVVEEIQRHEAEGTFDDLASAKRMRVGDPVRVIDGPFADLIGNFCALAETERVIVLLDFLGRQVRATLPRDAVVAA